MSEGTIVFIRNKDTGLIEQAVVKVNTTKITPEYAEHVRAKVAGIKTQPIIVAGGEWNVEVV